MSKHSTAVANFFWPTWGPTGVIVTCDQNLPFSTLYLRLLTIKLLWMYVVLCTSKVIRVRCPWYSVPRANNNFKANSQIGPIIRHTRVRDRIDTTFGDCGDMSGQQLNSEGFVSPLISAAGSLLFSVIFCGLLYWPRFFCFPHQVCHQTLHHPTLTF